MRIRAVLDVLAHLVLNGGNTVGDSVIGRVIFEGQHVVVAVSAGNAQRRAAGNDARARHVPGIDGIAQSDVGELACANIPDGGESGQERDAGILGADQSLARSGNGKRLVPKLGIHGQVRVSINQSGQQCRIRQFDPDGIAGIRRGRRTNADNLSVFDEDRLIVERLARLHIEDVACMHHHTPLRLCASLQPR